MFLYPLDDGDEVLAIPQVSHAWLAWQAAAHWGNRSIARPAPRPEVLAAVLLHDAGWADFDDDPGIDDDHCPRTFDRMEVGEHLGIWQTSVASSARHCRYAGMLVADHHLNLAEIKIADLETRGRTELVEPVRELRQELIRQRQHWGEELGADSRYEHALSEPGWTVNSTILRACDRLAVFLCAGWPVPFEVEACTPSGDPVSLTFSSSGERSLRVRPWPFEGSRLRLSCEGRLLERQRFDSAEDLRHELELAPVRRLGFTLLRTSAHG